MCNYIINIYLELHNIEEKRKNTVKKIKNKKITKKFLKSVDF